MILEVLVGGAVWVGAEYMKKGVTDKQRLDRIFRKCGLYKTYDGKEDTPKLIRSSDKGTYWEYVYRMPEGIGFKDFEKKREVIENSLNSNGHHITLNDLKGFDIMGNYRGQLKEIKRNKNKQKEITMHYDKMLKLRIYKDPLKDYYEYSQELLKGLKGWEVPIGITREGLIKHDMQKHMIVAGTTDFGKTSVIKMIITSLLERRPKETILTLIDLKGGLAFSRFKGIPQLNGIATTLEEAKDVLNDVKKQLKEVFDYLEENGFEDVKEAGIDNRHFIFIDECAELASHGEKDSDIKELKVECEEIMSHIARLGRAAGFYIIYSTQYPTAEVLSTQIKQQCDARICLRVKNDYASKVVIDQEGAEKLPQIKGRAIYQTHENIVVQVPYVSNDYIKGVIQGV